MGIYYQNGARQKRLRHSTSWEGRWGIDQQRKIRLGRRVTMHKSDGALYTQIYTASRQAKLSTNISQSAVSTAYRALEVIIYGILQLF